MTENQTDPKIEQLMREFEERVRRELGSPIRMTFWGGMILDPTKVWVTREQADRSMKEIERFIEQRKKTQESPT